MLYSSSPEGYALLRTMWPLCLGLLIFFVAFHSTSTGKLSSSSLSLSASKPAPLFQVAVLHGYHSNARSLEMYLSNLQHELSDCANFTFLNAPHESLESLLSKSTKRSKRKYSWASPVGGYVDSLKLLKRANQELQGGIDVCIGHSQGGCMLAAILANQQQQQEIFPNLKLSIFLSAFYPLREDTNPLIKTKSLHIWGSDDMVVDPALSEDLKSRFDDAREVVREGGGHDPPRCDRSTKAMTEAIRQLMNQKVEIIV